MRIKLTNKAERGIGLRSMSTGKLTRYAAGDVMEVSDNVAIGLVNSGIAVEVEASDDDAEGKAQEAQQPEGDAEQKAENDAEGEEQAPESDAEKQPGADYDAMDKEELIAICKEKGIALKSRDTKKELVARLTEEK
jgi:hypothetical protein